MDGSQSSPNNQLVIVALPREDDYVRQVSSEKEPHLTLLYLGENKFDSAQLTHIADYVEYAASFLPRFMLDVLSRGELGPNKADVLFFDKKWSKDVITFREQLLQDPLISGAYHSTDQFPDWLPHLTMGFPGTPAKKDTRAYPGFSYVNFDRVALWTGTSTGPTFQLNTNDDGMEVAMSQIERGRSAVDDVLKHYGIKGMKWGVRRSDKVDAGASAADLGVSSDHKALDAARTKVKAGGTKALSNHELQTVITRLNLESQYSNLTKHQSELDRGLAATQKVLKVGATVESARRFLETPTGKAVKHGVKGAFFAAKVGAAAYTGGTSGAAAAGTSLVIRRAANHYTNGPK